MKARMTNKMDTIVTNVKWAATDKANAALRFLEALDSAACKGQTRKFSPIERGQS
jgi:hypothetical protein